MSTASDATGAPAEHQRTHTGRGRGRGRRNRLLLADDPTENQATPGPVRVVPAVVRPHLPGGVSPIGRSVGPTTVARRANRSSSAGFLPTGVVPAPTPGTAALRSPVTVPHAPAGTEAGAVAFDVGGSAPWLRVAETWQLSLRHPGPIALDAALATAVASVVSGSASLGVVTGVSLVVAGLASGVWKRRSAAAAQGVVWYLRALLPALVVCAVAFLAAAATAGIPASLGTDLVSVAAVASALGVVRTGIWVVVSSARRRGIGLHPTLLIGDPVRVAQIAHRLRTYPEAGMVAAATFAPTPGEAPTVEESSALVESLVGRYPVDTVLSVADESCEPILNDIVRFARQRVDCALVLPLGAMGAGRSSTRVGDLGLVPLQLTASWGSDGVKRVLDVVVACTLLVALAPLLAMVAVAVRLADGGPALFCQQRVGRHGRSFPLLKFRSMVVHAEDLQLAVAEHNVGGGLLFKVDHDPRITPVGSFLRRLSIDELPQLVNVVRGEMSLVGPRPLPVDPDEFDLRAQIRHLARPGITGPWQVLGGNALAYDDMVQLDLTYITTRSLGTDLSLLVRTIPALVIRRAAY